MAYMRPFILREKYWAGIEKEIQHIFNKLIYHPLAAILLHKPAEIFENAIGNLLVAVRAGTVWYEDGQFHGRFSSKLTKELYSIGATYNAKSRTWTLPDEKLPTDIRFAQAQADAAIEQQRTRLLAELSDAKLEDIGGFIDIRDRYAQALDAMQTDFVRAAAVITIPPALTKAQRDLIAREWSDNLELYIKGWASDNILKLRTEVEQHAFAGGRAQGLVKMLQDNYGVGQRKAEFLARQETSLLMSKFRESRYGDIGITRYRWSTSHDERVRKDHKALNGKVFSFDSPPITDKRTGARNNPGEDFNCRCIAIPIVD